MKKFVGTVLLALFAVCVVSATVFASAAGDLQKLVANGAKIKSAHKDFHDDKNGITMNIDFVAPDRYRIISSNGTGELIVGTRMWMYNKGKWTAMPPFLGAMVQSFVKKARQQILASDYIDFSTVKSLGTKMEGGKLLTGYSYSMKNNLGTETVWVDRHGFPVEGTEQSGAGSGTFRYSKVNEPIDISAP